MKTILIIFGMLILTPAVSQTGNISREQAYKTYSNFVGGKWEAKGKWKNGSDYHQEIIVETELTKNIFTVKTQDYIDSKQFDNSRRNYGVRAWDDKEKKMKFWEFDVFGGIVTGEIIFDGNNIYHVYQYPLKSGGTKMLADAWIYINKDSYTFKIAEFNEGKLGKEYMSSTFNRKS